MMSHAKNKVLWCLKKAERELAEGKKHRGLIKIEPDLEKAKNHLEKSEHNLKATFYLKQGGFTDWCSSALFYTIYHCFLAIIAKYGYETKNQDCTFALIELFIAEGRINITIQELEEISNLNTEEKHSSETIVEIRETLQYTTKLTLKDETYDRLLNLAKEILHKTKQIIEE